MGYGLQDLQNILRYSARNAKTAAEYPNQQLDFALQFSIREWMRITFASRRPDTLTLVPGSNVIDVLPTGFLPEYLLQIYTTIGGQLVYPAISVVTIDQLLAAQLAGVNQYPSATAPTIPATGQPCMIAFTDEANGLIYPTPDKAYLLNLWWWKNLAGWTAGQAIVTATLSGSTIGSITINVAGSLYATAPTITIVDPHGTGFTAGTVTVDGQGGVATIPISAAGTGYTAPVVYVNGVIASQPDFGLPDDALDIISGLGGPFWLQKMDAANYAFAKECHEEFKKQAKQFSGRGAGGRGAQVLAMNPPNGRQPLIYQAWSPIGSGGGW